MSTSFDERATADRIADPLPPLPPGSLRLIDLPQLTRDYLDSVQIRLNRVTGNLVPGDEGTFSVRVTNGAVRLTSWTLHLFSSDADVATIKAEPGLVITYRLTGDRDTPTVEPGSTHDELFAFFLQDTPSEPNNVLEPDEVRDLRFSYVAEGAGDAVFTAHLHGNVDVDSLFPRGNGADATGDVTVRRPPSTGN